jgi:mRNA-degrading endonuclease RelE of RelBE toxin-antitoxin system
LPINVIVSAQVRAYQRALAPEPRRRLKMAIAGLSAGKGDIKPLTDKLAGFQRLRVGEHRVVYRLNKGRIECFYAARRETVYEYLASHFRQMLDD